MTMMEKVQALRLAQRQLKVAKETELELRIDLASDVIGDFAEHSDEVKEKTTVGDFEVEVKLGEALKILDPAMLVELLESSDLDDDEQKALLIKPDITLARARKLDEDSQLWDYMAVKMSDTPTVKITYVGD